MGHDHVENWRQLLLRLARVWQHRTTKRLLAPIGASVRLENLFQLLVQRGLDGSLLSDCCVKSVENCAFHPLTWMLLADPLRRGSVGFLRPSQMFFGEMVNRRCHCSHLLLLFMITVPAALTRRRCMSFLIKRSLALQRVRQGDELSELFQLHVVGRAV